VETFVDPTRFNGTIYRAANWRFGGYTKGYQHFFKGITDPRRAQGRRHRIEVVLSMAAAAILCGMCGYKAISDWIKDLSQRARLRFGCRSRNKKHIVPSESTICNVLMRVDPVELDLSLQK